jgi:hypothetical protein
LELARRDLADGCVHGFRSGETVVSPFSLIGGQIRSIAGHGMSRQCTE